MNFVAFINWTPTEYLLHDSFTIIFECISLLMITTREGLTELSTHNISIFKLHFSTAAEETFNKTLLCSFHNNKVSEEAMLLLLSNGVANTIRQ